MYSRKRVRDDTATTCWRLEKQMSNPLLCTEYANGKENLPVEAELLYADDTSKNLSYAP